jgi:hypothetical protein
MPSVAECIAGMIEALSAAAQIVVHSVVLALV